MSAIVVNRTFEFNPESGQKHDNPAKIPRKLLAAPTSPSTAQDEFEFIDSSLPEAAKRNRYCQTNHADGLWAHNPEVAGAWSTSVNTSLACPSKFLIVPGSATYGTSDFCVVKYEAKQASATVPISQAGGAPWVYVSQPSAALYSANVAGCSGCHLITEAEWLTIAQNALNVGSNWTGGSVGSGQVFVGQNDNAPPATSLAADTNDSNGYAGGTNTGGNQRRTLTLSNGKVIWDLAGNVNEWTSATIAGGQQPGPSGETAYAWKEWNSGSLLLNGLPSSTLPSYGVPAADSWTSAQGIGMLWSNHAETSVNAFIRGAGWKSGSGSGVLSLNLSGPPSVGGAATGMKVLAASEADIDAQLSNSHSMIGGPRGALDVIRPDPWPIPTLFPIWS